MDSTPKQFFNALKGRYDYDSQQLEGQRNILFAAMRFNASSVAAGLSGKLSKDISKVTFDWEKGYTRKFGKNKGPINYDSFKSNLEAISK